MYVIRDRKSKSILHMAQSIPGESRKPEELLPGFDAKTMEFGRADMPAIPAWFSIENGIIKPEEPPPPEPVAAADAPTQSLDQLKEATIKGLSQLAFELRKKIIPEHELQNAALGVYDEKRSQAIRDTVKAFRDEYHRLEATVKKAKSAKELQSLKPNFPTKVESAPSGPPKRGEGAKEKK
jgi:hypothetical protein